MSNNYLREVETMPFFKCSRLPCTRLTTTSERLKQITRPGDVTVRHRLTTTSERLKLQSQASARSCKILSNNYLREVETVVKIKEITQIRRSNNYLREVETCCNAGDISLQKSNNYLREVETYNATPRPRTVSLSNNYLREVETIQKVRQVLDCQGQSNNYLREVETPTTTAMRV